MSSVWARLAVLIIALDVFAAHRTCSSLADCSPEPSLVLPRGNSDDLKTWTDPVAGINALAGLRLLGVGRRDCLSNGSNYCFGNNIDFCPDCGNCCVDGKYCCGRGKVCCGSGCCGSGQTCSQGKCASSVAAITVTSTVIQTITRIATQRATVVIAQIETSTAVSTVDVTISSAATQTDVVWVTSTALARRDRGLKPPSLSETRGRTTSAGRGRPHGLRDITPIPQHAIRDTAPTVTEYATRTTDVTSISSVITTASTTSTVIAIVYQTNTRVLNARTTITVTSTLTITSHPAKILTITTTASLIPPRTSSPTAPPPSPSPPTILSTPTIAGVATGASILAVLLGALVVLSIRRRRRHYHHHRLCHRNALLFLDSSSSNGGGGPYHDDHHPQPYGDIIINGTSLPLHMRGREPALPPLPAHFGPGALPAAHHAEPFRLPGSYGTHTHHRHHHNHHHDPRRRQAREDAAGGSAGTGTGTGTGTETGTTLVLGAPGPVVELGGGSGVYEYGQGEGEAPGVKKAQGGAVVVGRGWGSSWDPGGTGVVAEVARSEVQPWPRHHGAVPAAEGQAAGAVDVEGGAGFGGRARRAREELEGSGGAAAEMAGEGVICPGEGRSRGGRHC